MGKMNKIIIFGIVLIALFALSNTASAVSPSSPDLTFKFDKIQVNGVYHGIPVLLPGGNGQYGFNYVLIPDGTYTVFGQVTNSGSVDQHVGISVVHRGNSHTNWLELNVPKAGNKPTTVSWQYTFASPDTNFEGWMGSWESAGVYFYFEDVDIVNAPENVHTVDQGPMSNAVAIYSNGAWTYNGTPSYSISLG